MVSACNLVLLFVCWLCVVLTQAAFEEGAGARATQNSEDQVTPRLDSPLILFLPSPTGTNFTLTPNSTKRLVLSTKRQYTFSVVVQDAMSSQYAAIVFQLHCQRHQITLSRSPALHYGDFVNGSHIGLFQELKEDNSSWLFYATVACLSSCNTTSREAVQVLAAVSVVLNQRKCMWVWSSCGTSVRERMWMWSSC